MSITSLTNCNGLGRELLNRVRPTVVSIIPVCGSLSGRTWLASAFMKARGGRNLTESLLKTVIPDVYSGTPTKCVHAASSIQDKQVKPKPPYVAPPAPPSKWALHRYYSPADGEFRALIIGTHVWFNVADVRRFSHLDVAGIVQIAGPERMVIIPNADVFNADDHGGVSQYVVFDAVHKLLSAMWFGSNTADSLEQWISRDILSPANQLKSGNCVHAAMLHQVLGKHLEFATWVDRILSKNPHALSHLDFRLNIRPGEDFEIPLTEAFDIAQREGSYAGIIVSNLLRDGGYFHDGPVAETADAMLDRYRVVMPGGVKPIGTPSI